MNIARASPFDYQNGRIRSSRRQLCWLYCDSMQIPPTAILQPIARTISSMVFPASTDRATNRKKRSIYRVLWGREDVETSFHCIVFHNSTLFIVFVISVNVNCLRVFMPPTHTSSRHSQKITQLKSRFLIRSRYLDSLQKIQRRNEWIQWFIFFPRNPYYFQELSTIWVRSVAVFYCEYKRRGWRY